MSSPLADGEGPGSDLLPLDGWSGTRGKGRLFVFGLPVLVLVVIPAVLAVRVHQREAVLKHGVRAEAVVLGTDRAGSTDYLRVGISGDCACTVEIATDNLAGHPLHSTIPVRYDPRSPQIAEALVDRPNPYGPVLPLAGGPALGIAIVGPVIWRASRLRRRSLALLGTAAPAMRVRIEAWGLSRKGRTSTYLSVYPADSPPGAQALLCLPTDRRTLATLRPGETFDLFGDPIPGRPLALRDCDVVVACSGRTRPGSWEINNRAPGTDVELPTVAAASRAGSAACDEPLFADAAQARAWRRNSTLTRWLLPLLIVLLLIRLLPPVLMWWALPLIAVAVIGEYAILWRRRRLLDHLALRLAGPPATGRRARQAARSAAGARLTSPAGLNEMAALLGTSPERLRREQQLGSRLIYGAVGAMSLTLVAVLLFPSAVADALATWIRPHPPGIAGAPGYGTFTGPLGRPLPVGRPWGRPCQPIRFAAESRVPDDVYQQVAAVVAVARRDGVNVTVENHAFMWNPASLYYPPGTTTADVQQVPIFADRSVPPRLGNGRPERVSLGWDARPDADGRHEDFISAQAQLRLASLNGDPLRERTAVRQIVAFTQGVSWSSMAGSGITTGTTADDFSAADLHAMRLMSGCGTRPMPATPHRLTSPTDGG